MRNLHVLTFQIGADQASIMGIYADRDKAFDDLETAYDNLNADAFKEVESVTYDGFRGFTFHHQDETRTIRLMLHVDQYVTHAKGEPRIEHATEV